MLNRDHDTFIFQEVGGVRGLSDLLKSNLNKGVSPDEDELLRRRDIFGANTYPRKKRRSIWSCLISCVPLYSATEIGVLYLKLVRI